MSTVTVSPLRQRMIEDMNARKLCAETQRGHIHSCRRFAAFLKQSPDTATAEDIRRFQLHLSETGVSICNRNRIMTGLRFLLRVTLRRLDLAAEIYHIREPQKIPLVMSQDETRRLLAVASSLKARTLFSLGYGCGLRASEVVRLKVKHIDRAQNIIRVEQSKGRKDRNVMLSAEMLDLLRQWWKVRPSRHDAGTPMQERWLFPGAKHGQTMSTRQLKVAASDFVFVAGNMAFRPDGTLDPKVYVSPARNWGGETAFRRQVRYVITDRLEPSLKAAGSALQHSLKAQAYIRGIENLPDFMDVWSQHFRDIPCAITPVPAKDYGNTEGMIEINLIALKEGARRRKQIVATSIPTAATYGPCVRAGELVFPSGLIALGEDGRVPGADQASAFDALSLAGELQGALLMSYMDAVCQAVGVSAANVVRAQYFLSSMADFAGIAAAWQDRYGRQPHPFACVQVPGPMPASGAVAIGDFWVYAG